MLKKFFLIYILFLAAAINAYAQVPQWVTSSGSSGPDDIGIVCKTAPNGTVIVAGQFSGTMDLDPSSFTHNISSFSNTQDIFLASYSSSGSFLWGFAIGRNDIDGVNTLAIDNNSNIYIGGYFRDGSLDFDPSISNTATIPYAGNASGATAWGGDGFIAKYSSTGAYQWAYSFGSSLGREAIDGITIDNSNNIIISGVFKDSIDLDYSVSNSFVNSNTKGTVFLAKYNSSMQFQWGFNFGKPGFNADNSIRGVKTDAAGNIYLSGFVQNDTTLDFDPSASVAHYTVNGLHDAFVAKYSPTGAYTFAFLIGNNGVDDFMDIDLDSANNIYVTGYSTTTSVDFDPSAGTAIASVAGGGNDIMLASYTSTGQYRWGKLIGDVGDDMAVRLDVAGNSVFITGSYNLTVNFNPGSTPSANLVNNGNIDVFAARYALNGNYRCCFNVGSGSTDKGSGICIDATGQIFLTGAFSGTNTDFDPTTGTLNKTSVGSIDMFLARYDWPTTVLGYLTGDTICNGEQAYLTYTDTVSGLPTTTINYTDGVTIYTANVNNGVPFAINPSPTSNKNYSLSIPTGLCYQGGAIPQVTVVVNPKPIANAGTDTAVCGTGTIQLNGTGGGSYSWLSVQPITNPTSSNPTVQATVNGIYKLIVTNNVNCTDTDEVNVMTLPLPVANAGQDIVACAGTLVQLQGNGGTSYTWYSTLPVTNPTVQNPQVQAQTGTVYLAVINAAGCHDTDEMLITAIPLPTAFAGNDTAICIGTEIELKGNVTGTSAVTHTWYSIHNIPNPGLLNIKITIDSATVFSLVATDSAGCADTSYIKLSLIKRPDFKVSPEKDTLCIGESTTLSASGGGTYNWSADNFSSGTQNVNISPQNDMLYTVVITGSDCDYKDTFDIQVSVKPLPEVQITKSNDISCSDPSSTLTTSGAANYTWEPSEGLDNKSGSSVIAKPKETTDYTVTGITEFGCKDTAGISVAVKHDGEADIMIPSAFSPDGNGLNDCFRVKANFDFYSYKLLIYNRVGESVFSSGDIMDCWDGRHKSATVENRTFYYYVEIMTKACGTLHRKGDITVIR